VITRASRLYLAGAAAAYVSAIIWGLSTGGHVFGVFSLGYKEAVGEQFGYTILMGVAGVSLALGLITEAFRDADPQAQAQVAHLESVPEVEATNSASYWPIVGAFAVATMAVGLVVNTAMFIGGLVALGIVIVEWSVKAWSDRVTGDPAVNRAIRNRLMHPIEIPVGALLGIAFLVLMVSRVLLALPKTGSTAIAISVAVVILLGAILLTSRPKAGPNVLAGLLLVGGIAVIAGGITAASVGPREFEHHEDKPYEQPPVGGELPAIPPPTTSTTLAPGATPSTTEAATDTTETTAPGDQSPSTTAGSGSGASGSTTSTTAGGN
jgi:hypothetical protein